VQEILNFVLNRIVANIIPLNSGKDWDNKAKAEYKAIPEEIKQYIENISAKALIYGNRNLYSYMYARIEQGIEKKKIKENIKITFGFALLHSLVYDSVIYEIKNNKKIFQKMDYELIHCFLSCFAVSTLFNGVFQQKQLLEYKSIKHNKKNSTSINKLIGELLNIGYIEQLNTQQVYSKTGLVSASNNKGTYARKNYRISLKGHAEIDRFIKIYTSLHEKMTENTFLHDFLTLK
jgi:hypothetical protein